MHAIMAGRHATNDAISSAAVDALEIRDQSVNTTAALVVVPCSPPRSGWWSKGLEYNTPTSACSPKRAHWSEREDFGLHEVERRAYREGEPMRRGDRDDARPKRGRGVFTRRL